jgi:ABC-type bacteriocin/lantibiotic exporter with double-glycine peptidase domain
VLDEPTDTADEGYERGFVAALSERKHRQITLLVSHRAETLSLCDRFLVLDHGTVLAETDDLDIARTYLGAPRARAA